MTEEWKRITIAEKPRRVYTEICPDCGGSMEATSIPCPDGIPTCLVLHYGYLCSMCGAMWGKAPVVDEVQG